MLKSSLVKDTMQASGWASSCDKKGHESTWWIAAVIEASNEAVSTSNSNDYGAFTSLRAYLETRGGLYCLCELDHTSMDALSHLHIALFAWTVKHTSNQLLQDQSEAREHTHVAHGGPCCGQHSPRPRPLQRGCAVQSTCGAEDMISCLSIDMCVQ